MSEGAQGSAKLITVFGTPSGFTRFGVFVVHSLLRATVKEFDHTAASEIQYLRAAWSTRRHENFLLFADCPERAIVDTYLRTKAPVIIFYEDPKDVALDLVRERSLQATWAVRVAEQTLTTFSDLISCDQALVVQRERQLSLSDFLVSTSGHFGLPLADAHLDSVAKEVAPGLNGALGMSMDDLYHLHWTSGEPNAKFDPALHDMSLFEPVFERLRRLAQGQTIKEIDWPIFMMIAGGAPNSIFNGSVDLVGPARCVIYGPYMCLPTGLWRLNAAITVADNHSGNELEIDIYQSDILVRNRFALPAEGDLEVRAQFKTNEPRDAVQLRLITTEGAIEGRLSIRSISLVKLDRPSE